MSLTDKVRARIADITARRAEIADELEAIAADPEARGLADDDAITARLTELRAERDALASDETEARQRLADLERDAAEREVLRAAVAAAPALARNLPAGESVVRRDERTYNPDAEKRGMSFVADVVARAFGDFEAAERLSRHMAEERVERGAHIESRAVGTGAFTGLVVPQYLTDMVAPLARAGRPFADICRSHQLPAAGMTVNISRITTGTSAAVQASENAAVSETNIDDTLLTVPVNTIAGQQTISRQAIERGTGIDQVVLADLVRAYHTTLDNQLLNGSGGSGQHQGLQTLSGVEAVTYTEASPTAANAWPRLMDIVQKIQSGVFAGVTHFVMHPRRFWWFASNVGTSFPFLQLSSSAPQTGGNVAGTGYGSGPSGILAGIPVIVDGNVSTTVSSTQDVIYAVTAPECHLWEDANAPLFIRAEQTAAASLGVLMVVYGYSAFTAGRYPGAQGRISGSGLAAPVFA
jgi:HK97 family phage major capsid protein